MQQFLKIVPSLHWDDRPANIVEKSKSLSFQNLFSVKFLVHIISNSDMKKIFILFLLLFLPLSFIYSQQKKSISLEDIWQKGTLRAEAPQGMAWYDDKYYSSISENTIIKINALTGITEAILFPNKEQIQIEEYIFSDDKKKILIATGSEQIYRHSYKAEFYLFETETGKLRKIFSEKINNPSFSPDGKKIAFIYQNNLYHTSISDLKIKAITDYGKINQIIVGATDWVYEEEFSFTQAYVWSPDSRRIGFLVFDESEVDEYTLQYWNELYPVNYTYKYPKAGTKNSIVTVNCFNTVSGETVQFNLGKDPSEYYFPRINWTQDSLLLSVQTLNRLQNHFRILHLNAKTKNISVAYEEKNNSYVEITDDLKYLKDGKHFLITSEKDGYKHLYRYSMDGKLVSQLTKGRWEIDKICGIDEKTGMIYYTSTEVSPVQRHLFQTDLNGKNKKQLTSRAGTHHADFSPGLKYYIHSWSALNIPPVISLVEVKTGKVLETIISNERLRKNMESYSVIPGEFFEYTTEDNVKLNGYSIKPAGFDPEKKYPVVLFVYGGPGIQIATDSWKGPDYFWQQMLADKGYLIFCIDNRGTGGRGAEFKKCTQNQLGKLETEDVINTAKYLQMLPYVDEKRVGIFGWSFGGYLASLAMTKGSDFFKAGIAVAPVTSWRLYDTIYTERFLGLPQDNAKGYDENSPLNYADRLKGNYLLIHGTADDNVHLQNAYMMQQALIQAGKQFDAFYYPDKNHGIYGGNTRYHLFNMISNFIFEKL
jgi:dipeptidyl-peptidase-4